MTLSPLFVNKLNKLGSDLNGANGRQNVPSSTYDFLQRLKDVLSSESPPVLYLGFRNKPRPLEILNVPSSTYDSLQRLKDVLSSEPHACMTTTLILGVKRI